MATAKPVLKKKFIKEEARKASPLWLFKGRVLDSIRIYENERGFWGVCASLDRSERPVKLDPQGLPYFSELGIKPASLLSVFDPSALAGQIWSDLGYADEGSELFRHIEQVFGLALAGLSADEKLLAIESVSPLDVAQLMKDSRESLEKARAKGYFKITRN